MARSRRGDGVSLNFDSLTDTITNLTGTMILVVVLVFGMTRPKALPSPPPSPAESGGPEGRPAAPLLAEIELLARQITQIDKEIQTVEGELPALQQRLDVLVNRAKPTHPADPKPKATTTTTVQARLDSLHHPREVKPNRGECNRTVMLQALTGSPVRLAAGVGLVGLLVGDARPPDPANSRIGDTAPIPTATAAPADVEACLRLVQAGVERNRQLLDKMPARIHKLDKDLVTLLEAAKGLSFGTPAQKPPEEPKPEEVYYRPPLRRHVEGKGIILFVCAEGRVSFLDTGPLGAYMQDLRRQFSPNSRSERKNISLDCPGSDFRIQGFLDIEVERSGTRVEIRAKGEINAVRKPQCPGESAEEIQADGSRFRRTLARSSAGEYVLQFSVYPDSYEIFRKARDIVWKAQYQVDWVPKQSSQKLSLGIGQASAQ